MANNEIKEWPPITGSSSRTKRVHVAVIILRLLFMRNRKRFRVLQRVPGGEFRVGRSTEYVRHLNLNGTVCTSKQMLVAISFVYSNLQRECDHHRN